MMGRAFAEGVLLELLLEDAVEHLGSAAGELEKARVPLGHGLRELGGALRGFWLVAVLGAEKALGGSLSDRSALARQLVRFHPEVPLSWVAREVQGCACDRRSAASCSAGDPFDELARYFWCSCQRCHAEAERGAGPS